MTKSSVLRGNSRWTLQVREPVGESLAPGRAGVAGKGALPHSGRRAGCGRPGAGHLHGTRPPGPRTGPPAEMPSRRAAEPTARGVRAAGRPFGLPQPRNATGAASSAARRPRTPRPIRPFLRSPLPLRRAEAHCQRDRHPALKMRESAGSKRPRLNTNTRHETRREGPTPVPCTSACLKKKKKDGLL